MSGARPALLSLELALIGLVVTATTQQTLSDDEAPKIPPMLPSEYAVAAERSLQGLFLEMLERDDADDGDGHQLDPRGEMAESALRIRYDQEVAKLLAPTGRWTLSQHDDVSDTFAPHQTVPTSWPCKRQALKAAALP